MKTTPNNSKPDKEMDLILETLKKEHLPGHPRARIEAIRYYPESIWIRVIDPDYAKVHLTERSDGLWNILFKHFSNKTINRIGALFCLAPKEMKRSKMSLEFDDPHPPE